MGSRFSNPSRRAVLPLLKPNILHFCSPPNAVHIKSSPSFNLVLASSLLARLQLLQIPSTDLHIALVLIQALSKLLGIDLAALLAPTALRSIVSLSGNSRLLWLLGCWLRGTTSEESADCVPDGGTYCYTSVSR